MPKNDSDIYDSLADFSWPIWTEELVLSDDIRQLAYESLGSKKLGIIKTIIAQYFALFPDFRQGAPRIFERRHESDCPGFFRYTRITRPLDKVVYLLGENLAPASLLASILPAIITGVAEIAVLRIGETAAAADDILGCLEQCGLESVFAFTEEHVSRFLQDCVSCNSETLLINLDIEHEYINKEIAKSSLLRTVKIFSPRKIAVFCETGEEFDFEALAFAHPQVIFDVFGTFKGECLKNALDNKGNLEDLVRKNYQAVFMPEKYASESDILKKCALVLGPGQEGMWVWPELLNDFFLKRSFAFWRSFRE